MYGFSRQYCSLVRAIKKTLANWQRISGARSGPVMVCKLHRRQNPFPTKVPRAFTTIPRLSFGLHRFSWRSKIADAKRDEPRPCFARNYESILVFLGFSTGTESTRRRAVNAPLHPAKKEPQRVRHLAVSPNIRPQRLAAMA